MNYGQPGSWKKWVWMYVVVAIVLYGGVYLYYRDKNGGTGLYGNSSTPTPSATPTPSLSTTNAIINTETSASIGQYLADGSGRTFYTSSADTVGVSNCESSCITTWPVATATATSDLPANVTVISRADGTKQFAYNGMPLYYYVGDATPGQINGIGLGTFSAAKP